MLLPKNPRTNRKRAQAERETLLSSFVRIEKTILLEHFEKERSWEKKPRVPDLRH